MSESHYFSHESPAVAFYLKGINEILILKGNNNIGIRMHEYGHWFNACVYSLLDIFWEFIWWGLSIRNIFVKGN